MIVDTGAAITLLTKKRPVAHGLNVKEKATKYISGANRIVVKIVGMTSMILLLAPTLELDVANVSICSGNFHQGLPGYDLLCRHNEVLSAATITLPGPD